MNPKIKKVLNTLAGKTYTDLRSTARANINAAKLNRTFGKTDAARKQLDKAKDFRNLTREEAKRMAKYWGGIIGTGAAGTTAATQMGKESMNKKAEKKSKGDYDIKKLQRKAKEKGYFKPDHWEPINADKE